MFIKWEGGKVWLLFHDHLFLKQYRWHRTKIKKAHPDYGGSQWKLRQVLQNYHAWRDQEERWYRKFHLTTPIRVSRPLKRVKLLKSRNPPRHYKLGKGKSL